MSNRAYGSNFLGHRISTRQELADLILRGVEKSPQQAFGDYSNKGVLCGEDLDSGKPTCALGAALMAAGMGVTAGGELRDSVQCPVCDSTQNHTVDLVAHLNDDHQLTRESIAHWLKSPESFIKEEE